MLPFVLAKIVFIRCCWRESVIGLKRYAPMGQQVICRQSFGRPSAGMPFVGYLATFVWSRVDCSVVGLSMLGGLLSMLASWHPSRVEFERILFTFTTRYISDLNFHW